MVGSTNSISNSSKQINQYSEISKLLWREKGFVQVGITDVAWSGLDSNCWALRVDSNRKHHFCFVLFLFSNVLQAEQTVGPYRYARGKDWLVHVLLMTGSTAVYLNLSTHTSTLIPSTQVATGSVTSTDISTCSVMLFLWLPSAFCS